MNSRSSRSLSDASGIDLVTHGTVSDADTIRDTEIAQPLIVAASIVTGALLVNGRRDSVGAVAGDSVGEFAAAYLAGVLSDVDAIRLVGVRGRAMALEASKVATGMSAVLGGEPDVVQARLSELGLTAANMNGGVRLSSPALEPTTHVLKVCMRKAVLNLIRPVYPRLPIRRTFSKRR